MTHAVAEAKVTGIDASAERTHLNTSPVAVLSLSTENWALPGQATASSALRLPPQKKVFPNQPGGTTTFAKVSLSLC